MSATAYKPRTVWLPVAPWPSEAPAAPSAFDTSAPSHILAREPGAFRVRGGHNANMPQMALPGTPKHRAPGHVGPLLRKANPCTQARDAFILARRDAGDTYKEIALQVGVSLQRTRQIYERMAKQEAMQ